MRFNFQKYVIRSLEDDFNVIIGISPTLWACGNIIMLLNIHRIHELFWVTLLLLVLILAVGTKLQTIIATMAVDIKQRHEVIQGMPLVELCDHHFWFGWPRLVLHLIHFTLFVNAFQLTNFFWIWYNFGLNSCFFENFGYVIARICIGIVVHLLCSYITFPLYALVSQMGSHMKLSIFDEQISKALKKWFNTAKKHPRQKEGMPSHSPFVNNNQSINYSTSTMKRSHSYNDILHADIEMPIATSQFLRSI